MRDYIIILETHISYGGQEKTKVEHIRGNLPKNYSMQDFRNNLHKVFSHFVNYPNYQENMDKLKNGFQHKNYEVIGFEERSYGVIYYITVVSPSFD